MELNQLHLTTDAQAHSIAYGIIRVHCIQHNNVGHLVVKDQPPEIQDCVGKRGLSHHSNVTLLVTLAKLVRETNTIRIATFRKSIQKLVSSKIGTLKIF